MKKMMPILVILAMVMFVGCENLKEEKFQLIASSDGSVYRLNKKDGSVSVIQNGQISEIKTGRIKLEVGKLYEAEDGKIVKYIGKQEVKVWNASTKKLDGVQYDYILKEAPTWEDFKKQGKVEPRKPGETIPEYLKRTGQE
jgi:hypothetical protein